LCWRYESADRSLDRPAGPRGDEKQQASGGVDDHQQRRRTPNEDGRPPRPDTSDGAAGPANAGGSPLSQAEGGLSIAERKTGEDVDRRS
jgi:hypothetical protein